VSLGKIKLLVVLRMNYYGVIVLMADERMDESFWNKADAFHVDSKSPPFQMDVDPMTLV
jgi:hypothetical protein